MRLKLIAALAGCLGVGALIPLTLASADPQPKVTTFDEISVQRLNIVEPNGRYRLVLANSARFPGLFMDGREYRHHSRTGGGMWFYNDDGDEVGGLTYRNNAAGRTASASLMFDQYKQDQTVGIEYTEGGGQRRAGLRVWDRPDYSIQPLMEMSDRAARASSDAERDRIRGEMRAFAQSQGGVGAERVFAGKTSGDAIVRLADPEGRPRLLLRVGTDGTPSIEFLDEAGNVVRRIAA
ncbi:hypothetical protein [Sphingosinicella sp. CPCC 101087]|uniref:hypothetical protein n=1 Tax=Sphingosinicella sp. CPCC 101087 TaxID=2497754 RepID=UPI00101C73FE|nr:hypothetical protein [Sphingosinicella sp. CPCC 101087]